jgi:hypothetical protein
MIIYYYVSFNLIHPSNDRVKKLLKMLRLRRFWPTLACTIPAIIVDTRSFFNDIELADDFLEQG